MQIRAQYIHIMYTKTHMFEQYVCTYIHKCCSMLHIITFIYIYIYIYGGFLK